MIPPIYKKYNRTICKNYWEIRETLKLYERRLAEGLTLSGFGAGFTMHDHIFTIEQIITERWISNKRLQSTSILVLFCTIWWALSNAPFKKRDRYNKVVIKSLVSFWLIVFFWHHHSIFLKKMSNFPISKSQLLWAVNVKSLYIVLPQCNKAISELHASCLQICASFFICVLLCPTISGVIG